MGQDDLPGGEIADLHGDDDPSKGEAGVHVPMGLRELFQSVYPIDSGVHLAGFNEPTEVIEVLGPGA